MWPFRDAKREEAIPTFSVESTIGAGSRVRGDLSGPGGFRVDGTIEGGINADGPVVVGEGGSIEGSVRGRDIVILGRVRGDVHASGHLEIGPKGQIVGDITVKSFRLHTGGVFRGMSCMPDGEEARPTLGEEARPTLALATASEAAIEAALEDDTDAEGTAPATAEAKALARGRTLPPPNGAVPPPPTLAALARITSGPAPASDEAVSQRRLLLTSTDEKTPTQRATGT